jgi:hypothetical protein
MLRDSVPALKVAFAGRALDMSCLSHTIVTCADRHQVIGFIRRVTITLFAPYNTDSTFAWYIPSLLLDLILDPFLQSSPGDDLLYIRR